MCETQVRTHHYDLYNPRGSLHTQHMKNSDHTISSVYTYPINTPTKMSRISLAMNVMPLTILHIFCS